MEELLHEQEIIIEIIIRDILCKINDTLRERNFPIHFAVVKPTLVTDDNNNIYQVAEQIANELSDERDLWKFRKFTCFIGRFPNNFAIGLFERIC
jgi:hypothetical protein